MTLTELVRRVDEILGVDVDEFDAQVATEAETLKTKLGSGVFDNPQPNIGLEYELYGIDRETDALVRIPRQLLEFIGFEAELGLHNAEMHTSPQPLNRFGLSCQETEIQSRVSAALNQTAEEDIRLVSDGFWTIPPVGESAIEYLGDSVERDGIRLAVNMTDSVRYQGMANVSYPAKQRITAPHVDFQADTVVTESLTTSIQPHYQVADASNFPVYYRYAIRVAGPVLALGVNSPFYPPSLYGDASAADVLADHWMENRIPAFEDALNPSDGRSDKVRFPEDVHTVGEAVDRIADDETIVPMEIEPAGRFDDEFRHFSLKRQSFWRWVRPVFDAETPSAANLRVEFRPLPAQPTVRDSVAFLALFAGLMEELPERDHPVASLEWESARENFYSAVRHGLDADLEWITESGERTADATEILTELLECARDGLARRGVPQTTAEAYLRPLRGRVRHRTSPAGWKHERVRERVDAGESLGEAIRGMQSEYVERQQETLLTGTFLEWLSNPAAT